ncbi:unnamed protein product [Enterobius vermicularis]|uniref:Torsin n=1 Tax=Enterobius vermicularis TaxID=51028 RepID=A0A0N4V954_ENTVE|nr:unnamed protein product [Enterobius vermicularis]
MFPCYWLAPLSWSFLFLELESLMRKDLYGQHLAQQTVLGAISSHWNNRLVFQPGCFKSPKKALAISFHGWTGSGKTYLSTMIAESMKGMKSAYVHMFVSTLHFADFRRVVDYQNELKAWIHGNASLCERNLFIFDEVDKMPSKVMDVIKPFIDHYDSLEGVDYRKNIFIFLSNSGGNEIAQRTLQHYNAGKMREQITLEEMERVLIQEAFNSEGGLKTSELISRHLIDHFVPFLPLERKHILLCIRDYLRSQGYTVTNERITDIAETLQYFPKSNGIYSSSGCKRVAQKAELYMSKEMAEGQEFSDDL